MGFLGDVIANYVAGLVAGNVNDVFGLLATIAFLMWLIVRWHNIRRKEGKRGVQASHFLLIGFSGVWLFMTVALGSAAWIIWTRQSFSIGASAIGVGATKDEGPIQWVYSFSMEGGFSRNVVALIFRGANTSDRPVQIKEAKIISLIDGTTQDLEIVGVDPSTNENRVVSIDKVQLIIPGAPLQLVAKFGPSDPNNAGKVLGVSEKDFLDKWRKFSFNVKDDIREYKMEFNENSMMAFFQGKVGPRVMIKPGS